MLKALISLTWQMTLVSKVSLHLLMAHHDLALTRAIAVHGGIIIIAGSRHVPRPRFKQHDCTIPGLPRSPKMSIDPLA